MEKTRGGEGVNPNREAAQRKMNETGLALLKQWEGLRTKSYQDSGGVWTIGYGHTSAAGDPKPVKGMVISQAEAEDILLKDLSHVEAVVARAVQVPLNDNQFAMLVSFCYNVGEAAFRRSTLLKKLNKGDYESVPAELARWVHAKGKRLQGLVNRRAAEAGLWVKGEFVASRDESCAPLRENPYLKPEVVAPSIGGLAGLSGLVSGHGPFQWALALIMLAAFSLGAWVFIRRFKEKY